MMISWSLWRISACALAAVACALSTIHATRVLPVSLEELSQRAGKVFSGRCVATETVFDESLGMKITQVTFEVDRVVKGEADSTVTIRMLGEDSGVPGLPRFETGEDVILFLYDDSRLGLTSPVGMLQGKFRVHTDKNGEKLATNGTGNRGLFQNLSIEAQERLGPAVERWKTHDSIEPAALLEMVEELAGGQN
jgi:hypothetical protein